MKHFTSHIALIFTGLLLMVCIAGYGQEKPVIESVNVDSDGNVTIQWKQPTSTDARYIIYRWNYLPPDNDLYGFQPIEIVNASDLSYVDKSSDASQKKQIYRINLEGDETSESKEMQTVFLYEEIIYDECVPTNTVKWTSFFIGFERTSYIIKARAEGETNYTTIANLEQISLTPVTQILTYDNEEVTGQYKYTNVYEYTHVGFDPGLIYTYKVEAVYYIENDNSPQSSSSNLQSRNTPAYERPESPVIKRVSVKEDGSIILEGEITGSGIINGMEIWRTENENSNDLAIYQPLENPGIRLINFIDNEAGSSQTAYWYDLVLLDYCNKNIQAVNAHRSIFLTAEALQDESVELSWNAYEGWAVEGYRIYRKLGENPVVEIDFVTHTTYTDNTISQSSATGKISYFVMAVAANQPAGEEITTKSNRVNIGFDSDFFMPNAFKPGGITDVFKPISRFEPNSDYLFQIYNRWGQLIFETRDFLTGWDGSYNGDLVSRGTYIWAYQYTDSQGNNISKRGSVTVVY